MSYNPSDAEDGVLLDLGGTACFESRNAISVSLDGSTSGDEVCHNLIGDYNNMPFIPDETFSMASGSCYLEEQPNFFELWRVLAPGGRAYLKACDAGYAPLATIEKHMTEAGFEILERPVMYQEDDGSWAMDNPYIIKKGE